LINDLIHLSFAVIRTLLYPLTAFLGPTFNDWFGEQIRVNSALGLSLKSSCEDRKTETEADLLGLRILLAAGIDPKVALDVWGKDGIFDREARKILLQQQQMAESQSPVSEGWLANNGFTNTHPVNEERFRRIAEELDRWKAHDTGTINSTPNALQV